MLTKEELFSFATHSFAYTSSLNFELRNNASTTAYCILESKNGDPIFDTASIYSLISCSMVTESVHAAFIINPNSTASFTADFPDEVSKENIILKAANRKVISGSTTTYYGVDLTIT